MGDMKTEIADLSNEIGTSAYLAKFDNDGSLKYVKAYKCEGSVIGVGGISIDNSNNVLLTGVFNGIMTFGDYMMDIGIPYFSIPIICVGFGYLLEKT